MTRTAAEAAKILTLIYEEHFGQDFFEKYRIQWEHLRAICAVRRLETNYLHELSCELNELGFSLTCFDHFILVMKETDCDEVRNLPGRLVEKYIPEDPEFGGKTTLAEPEDVELDEE